MVDTKGRAWSLLSRGAGWLSLAAVVGAVVELGYGALLAPPVRLVLLPLYATSVALSVLAEAHHIARPTWSWRLLRRALPEIVLLVPLLATLSHPVTFRVLVLARQALVALRQGARSSTGQGLIRALAVSPAKLFVSSFLLVIASGTLVLTFPATTADGLGLTLIDALFTATSATCVTGLAVVDTGSALTTYGQVTVLLLFQIGGLGIMAFSAGIAVLLGQKLSQRQISLLDQMGDITSGQEIRRALASTVIMTFSFETLGALILTARFYVLLPMTPQDALYYGVFHAISAFCNAGFGLWADSLSGLKGDAVINLTVMGLIILGGLGFLVISDLHGRHRKGGRLSLHTTLALVTTLALTLAGALAFYGTEYFASLAGLSEGEKVMAALFQSVTARTAGFNTVPMDALSPPTLLIMLLLMFVGASPSSTGGGIKTTTAAIMILSIRATLQSRSAVEIRGRTISRSTVVRATAIASLATLFVVLGSFILLVIQPGRFDVLIFEAFSAFGTVGLSMGATPSLLPPAKALIMVMMFAGRVGPLTMAIAMGEARRQVAIRYPEGSVMVG